MAIAIALQKSFFEEVAVVVAPPAPPPAPPILAIEKVPRDLSLCSGQRFRIICRQHNKSFFYPIQLTEAEALGLLEATAGLDWNLSEGGFPTCQRRVDAIAERLLNFEGGI